MTQHGDFEAEREQVAKEEQAPPEPREMPAPVDFLENGLDFQQRRPEEIAEEELVPKGWSAPVSVPSSDLLSRYEEVKMTLPTTETTPEQSSESSPESPAPVEKDSGKNKEDESGTQASSDPSAQSSPGSSTGTVPTSIPSTSSPTKLD